MGIISPIMSFAVDQESDFPAPSEHEKINKAIHKYQEIINKFPHRTDVKEIKFGLADLYVGRNEAGDYAEAGKIYDEILKESGDPYLRARARVGKAELLTPGIKKEAIPYALELCENARKNLGHDLSDFFVAKTYIIEADLRMVRDHKDDHKICMKIHEKLIKQRRAHWYFRSRSLLGKAELILYHFPRKVSQAITLCERSFHLLADRKGDYFREKVRIIQAELLMRRGKIKDFKAAEKLFSDVIKEPHAYPDLVGRAKLDLAEISKHPKAAKLYKEVLQMEGLDPYLTDKARLIAKKFKEKEKAKKKKR